MSPHVISDENRAEAEAIFLEAADLVEHMIKEGTLLRGRKPDPSNKMALIGSAAHTLAIIKSK